MSNQILMRVGSLFVKSVARVLTPKNKLAAIVEQEAKRNLGKLGGGETIEREVECATEFLATIEAEGLLFFDIGANEGKYTAAMLSRYPNLEVIAFEPSQLAFEILEERFGNLTNVQCSNVALSDFDGQAQLFANKSGSGLGSLSNRDLNHLDIEFDHSETISVTRADLLIPASKKIPNFVKIDVEGHELSTLKGFGIYLFRIQLIQFEFGGCNIDTRTYFKDFWKLLDANFLLYRITPHGPDLISKYDESEESFMTSNFLAVNREIVR